MAKAQTLTLTADLQAKAIAVKRNQVKGDLLKERLVPLKLAWLSNAPMLGVGFECCYCGEVFSHKLEAFDLHEIIVSRGAAMGLCDVGKLAIMDKRNCGFIHRKCHPYAEGGEGRTKSIAYLLRYEGLANLMAFTQDIHRYTKESGQYARDIWQAFDALKATNYAAN